MVFVPTPYIKRFVSYDCIININHRRNVFTTGPAKLDREDYAIKCVGGQQLHEYSNIFPPLIL